MKIIHVYQNVKKCVNICRNVYIYNYDNCHNYLKTFYRFNYKSADQLLQSSWTFNGTSVIPEMIMLVYFIHIYLQRR